jgi:two-component system OmpR family response regulator
MRQSGDLLDLRVFVVEDQQRMHALLRELFAAVGGLSIVATAATEAEAIFWLEEHEGGWDVAVVDLLLEQGSGMGVIPRCKSLHPAGRVVIFSSYASPAVRKHCTALGADAVFDKADSGRFTEHFMELAQAGREQRPIL